MIFIELHMRSSSEHAHILHGSKPDPFFGAIYFIGVLFRCDVCE